MNPQETADKPVADAPPADTSHDGASAPQRRPGPLSIVQSVLAAAFGVQSEAKRQQDFQAGKPGDYILIGIIFVVLFVIGLIWLVRTVLSNAGV